MLASSGTQATIQHFLTLVQARTPQVVPRYIMSDFDWAQINACAAVFTLAIILLCWWHVLHAWQQHFHISLHPELWKRLKQWPRVSDEAEFWVVWSEIQQLAPPSMVSYLEKTWMPERVRRMWSGVHRVGRSILDNSDTNMHVESWHHVLKGKFLENRRNRRIDTLLHVLTTSVVKYYELRQRRCLFGFEGKNLEEKKRDEIIKQSQIFASADFKRVGALYAVTSKNNASKVYHVDLRTLKCTCPAFPAVSYCKHLCAAQQLEGPEAEAREYQAIRDAAQSYTAPDCVDWSDEDGLYLVMPPDTTDVFKVNLEEYNCDCDDYTELSFCEHLAATQRLFGTEDIRSQALSTLDVDRSPAPPPTALLPVPATIRTAPSRPQSRVTNLVQKMERLTGRLRQSSKNLPQQELDMLEAAVDAMLAGTESTSVLPTATFVAPNSKAGWSATQQSMAPGVPAVKTGHKRKDVSEDTDDAFGGGKRSGGKAPKQPRKAPAPPPALPPPPPPLIVPTTVPATWHSRVPLPFAPNPPPLLYSQSGSSSVDPMSRPHAPTSYSHWNYPTQPNHEFVMYRPPQGS
ncbi:hypothetical protein FB45DRAFT_844073 [Roridomyces roridus]|uniref:SWIM-type domain-containing protein n=1 Tax=Roridomyces roridus TaxID=1738132 RepID=A0AAD7B6E5_9AGAR|nr:hypothetical protein FB45DRAFT_844073 [Roridomyces roridus]